MASTVVSWALTVSLVGVGVFYYRPDLFKSSLPSVPLQAESSSRQLSKKVKSKKAEPGPAASNDDRSNKKRKIVPSSDDDKARTSTATAVQVQSSTIDDGDMGDKEFAQQLAKAQVGTNFQKTAEQSKKKTKATKQSQAKQLKAVDTPTEASSAAVQDTHDEETSVAEPVSNTVAKAGDISDMLEAPAAKPTTLRVTSVPDESKNKKKPAAQPFEQVLSKKQRQTQARKEEQRQMKEESDRIHEAKKQEQLRRARMAAGTSNQTKADNFTATANAWQSNSGKEAVKSAPPSAPVQLFDTFEPQANNVSQTNGAVHTQALSGSNLGSAGSLKEAVGESKAAALAASNREGISGTWAQNVSEEDQITLLKEQEADDAWESVTNKKSKKKTKTNEDTSSEADSAAHQAVAVPNAAPTANVSKSNGAPKRPATTKPTNRFGPIPVEGINGLTDAEWEA